MDAEWARLGEGKSRLILFCEQFTEVIDYMTRIEKGTNFFLENCRLSHYASGSGYLFFYLDMSSYRKAVSGQ